MGFLRSIRFQVWLSFEAIVVCMLTFSYAFLVLFFPIFYEMMKIDEIERSLETIQSDWYDINVRRTIETVAFDNKMYIEIYSPELGMSIPFNNMGGASALTNISKLECCREVDASENGIVYRRFRDEREKNSILMVCSYVGRSKASPDAYIFISSYLQPLGTTMTIFHRQFLFVAVVTAVITMCLSLIFASRISRPIIIMNKAVRELPQGRFSFRASKRDYSEIQQLSEALTAASAEIAKTDGLRRELVSNISHDLRTPLTMIKAYAEMIRDLSGDNPEKRARHLKIIIDETDRLSSLVNDILDLSKLESGVTEINKESFNFGERLRSVVARFDILRESEGITVELHTGDSIMIEADRLKLDQVVYNLINNAVTYVGEDKTVTVRLYRTVNRTVRFEVTDRGDGIAPENLPYIWDRYYKVSERSKTHKRAKMGSGIGLSIVKNILEQHGFRYGADSELGKGSCFWFEAPDPLPAPESKKE